MCFGVPAFIKKRKGLKNIPPPIPTRPEIKPIKDPIKIDKIFGVWFILIWSLLNDLLSINKKMPANIKITNSRVSKNSLSIVIEAPTNAKGIDPIR